MGWHRSMLLVDMPLQCSEKVSFLLYFLLLHVSDHQFLTLDKYKLVNTKCSFVNDDIIN